MWILPTLLWAPRTTFNGYAALWTLSLALLLQAPGILGRCIIESTGSEINRHLSRRGAHANIILCQKALVLLDETIKFTAPHQSISTIDLPDGEGRAVLQMIDGLSAVFDGHQNATMIDASCEECTHAKILNLRIDGGRGVFGSLIDGGALLELGSHAEVKGCELIEPRGTAAIRIAGKDCSTAEVALNDLVGWIESSAPEDFLPGTTLASWLHGSNTTLSSGIIVEECPKSIIRNNFFSNFAAIGIHVMGSSRINILDNTISISSGRTSIAGILAEGGSEGLRELTDQGLYISDNTVHVWNGYFTIGILIGGSDRPIAKGTYLARNTISSSLSQSSFAFGIAVSNAPQLQAEQNRLTALINGLPGPLCDGWMELISSTPFLCDDSTAEVDSIAIASKVKLDSRSLACFIKPSSSPAKQTSKKGTGLWHKVAHHGVKQSHF